MNISAFVLGKLAEAATSAAMRRQPLLKLIPDYLLNVLSDETKNQLLRGRVIGSARVQARDLAVIPEIRPTDDNAFVVSLTPIRREPFKGIR